MPFDGVLQSEATMKKRFESKVVLVTGGTSGMGRDAAVAFAREGARVCVVGRRVPEGEETISLIREAGGEGLFVQTDVRREDDIKAAVERCVSAFGGLDCAFNNAGIGGMPYTSLTEYGKERWDDVIAVNLTGPFLCMKYEIPEMLKRGGGSIVNLSSNAGIKSIPAVGPAYNASKAGLHGLSTTAAVEYASRGIRVNVVCPGLIRTPLSERGLKDETFRTRAIAKHPIGRIGEPAEVSALVLWLCSDEASFVTGDIIPVDGGMVLL
jgi:NAD(P)-dependent dehydrogenase (short-subunit alcohol dehydrogenase family)